MGVCGRGARTKRRFVAVLALAIASASAPSARAQGPATPPTPPAAQAKAEEHYKRARELYSQGSYREALGELEAARALDPNAKELVFNLGVVNEKLGNIDAALRWFRLYAQMDLSAQEKQKVDGFIKRLEGAKREVPPAPAPTTAPTSTRPPEPKREEPHARGRVDAATITAASVAGLGLAFGGVMGVKAAADRPKSFVTGRDGSYADFQRKTASAHKEAIAADIGLGIGVVAAAVTAYLYFGRTKAVTPQTGQASTRLSFVPATDARGGYELMVRGSF